YWSCASKGIIWMRSPPPVNAAKQRCGGFWIESNSSSSSGTRIIPTLRLRRMRSLPRNPLLTPAWPDAEKLLEQFEEAWCRGAPPRLVAFLAPVVASENAVHAPGRAEFLKELIRIDLEFRWRKRTNAGLQPWITEDYLRHYPEIGASNNLLV